MTVWYVHRDANNAIVSAHSEFRPGYAEEALEHDVPEMAAYLGIATAIVNTDKRDGLIERRARAAERAGDDLTAIKLRMGAR